MRYILLAVVAFNLAFGVSGKKVFETYCWGCHHQSAVAFGPPFSEIASKRSKEEIRAMIADPKSVSKVFGYKRNAMPAFTLKEDELVAITDYILSYKPKDTNATKENNTTADNNNTKSK
jgi:mono/diheme cytochrome c family protein